ncbi:MAG: flagellar biosynthetic protein FliR [Bacillota bacterium]
MNGVDPFLTALFPFACVFLRTVGLFVTAPVLGARFVPVQVRVGLSLATAYFLSGLVAVSSTPSTLAAWAGAALGEVLFGLFMGTCASILLAAVEVAGHVVDVEIGFGMANVIDPEFGSSSPLMGTFKYLLITVLFMALDGHHLFLWGLGQSFRVLPAGTAGIPIAWAEVAVKSASNMMLVAVVLSCPIWASMLITDVALGVLARSVPQLNIFVVGMPVKVLVGLTVLSASVGFYGTFTKEISLSVRSILESLLGVFAR